MAVSAFSRNHGTAHFRGTSILRHILQAASSCLLAAQLAFAPFAFAGGDKPAPALLNVRTNTAVRAEEEDKSPDFSQEKPQTHLGESAVSGPFERSAWEGEIKRLSAAFRKYPEVYFASVVLQIQNSKSRMVSNEGSAILSPSSSTRLIMEAQTRAEDGMDLLRVETFQAPAASGLPSEADLTGKIAKMAADLSALRKAPVAEPYDGPADLSGG